MFIKHKSVNSKEVFITDLFSDVHIGWYLQSTSDQILFLEIRLSSILSLLVSASYVSYVLSQNGVKLWSYEASCNLILIRARSQNSRVAKLAGPGSHGGPSHHNRLQSNSTEQAGSVAVTNGFQFGKQRTSFLLFRTLTMTADHGLIELIYIIIHVLIETYFVDLE